MVQLSGSLVGQAGVLVFARRVFPPLVLRPSLVTRSHLHELFGFSVWAFICDVAWKLVYGVDTVVIAILLGPKWITYYAVGGMLLMRCREFVVQAATVFSPGMIESCAREDWSALQTDFRRGSNLTMGIAILFLVGMIGFGREFIAVWMGPRFDISYHILAVLCVASLFDSGVIITGPIFSGLNRLKLSATVTLIQGIANLICIVLFVVLLQLGIMGVAWAAWSRESDLESSWSPLPFISRTPTQGTSSRGLLALVPVGGELSGGVLCRKPIDVRELVAGIFHPRRAGPVVLLAAGMGPGSGAGIKRTRRRMEQARHYCGGNGANRRNRCRGGRTSFDDRTGARLAKGTPSI